MTDKPSEIEFCPSHDDMFLAFMRLLPVGAAWQTDSFTSSTARDTMIKKFMSGLALSFAHLEDAMCDGLDQWFCYAADTDKDAWEKDYGIPDECDLYNASVCAKASAIHVTTAEGLTALLAANGYSAEGRWLTGTDIEYPGVHSTFTVYIDPNLSTAYTNRTVLVFKLGQHRRLGQPVDVSQAECMLERYIPAHTVAQVGVSGKWIPTSLGSKLIAWWNADDTSNGSVTSWASRVGGLTLTPITTAPTSAIGPNGFRYITFNGVDQALRTASIGTIPVGANAGTISVLARNDVAGTDSAQRTILALGTSAPGVRLLRRSRDATVTPNVNRFGSSAQGVDLTGTAQDFSGDGVAVVFVTPTSIGNRFRGRWSTPASAVISGLNTGAGQLTVGASQATTQYWQGGIRHIFFLSGSATMADCVKLEAWQAWDINDVSGQLPPDHPYANMRP